MQPRPELRTAAAPHYCAPPPSNGAVDCTSRTARTPASSSPTLCRLLLHRSTSDTDTPTPARTTGGDRGHVPASAWERSAQRKQNLCAGTAGYPKIFAGLLTC